MAARTILVEDLTVNEGVDTLGILTLRRTGDLTQTDTVDLSTVNGAAIDSVDFNGGIATIVFNPGETEKLISFGMIDDALAEGLETFTVALADPGGNAPDLTLQDGTVTIYDDENTPPDFFDAGTLSTEFGTPVTFTLADLVGGATDPDGDPVSFGEIIGTDC